MTSIWNEQNMKLLTELWPDHTATEITRKISGSTRSGIIGKASRMKLEKLHKRPVSYNRPPAKERNPHMGSVVSKSRKRTRPSDAEQINTTSYAEGGMKSMMDLQARECRWPVKSEGRSHMFCAANAEERGSYCKKHNSIGYQNGIPRRSTTHRQWEGIVK